MRLRDIFFSIWQWTFCCAWSVFWMTAAILGGLVFRDPNVPLSWARRYWGRGLLWVTGCQFTVRLDHVPQPGQPCVFVMNHQSMFDIIAAFVALPVNIRFVAKKVLRLVPFLGWYMMATGMVFIDRGNRRQALQSLREAIDKLRSGISILVYPEGTRSQSGVLPFKKGSFVMAIQAGVPIVPVAVEGSGALLPKNSMCLRPVPIRVAVGAPIPTAGLTHEDRDLLIERVRNSIIDLNLSLGGKGGEKGVAADGPLPLERGRGQAAEPVLELAGLIKGRPAGNLAARR